MSEARLPIAYRDSCANLLIPLNRCRYEEYYLPWKCEVCEPPEAPGTSIRMRKDGVVKGLVANRDDRQRDIAMKSASTMSSRKG